MRQKLCTAILLLLILACPVSSYSQEPQSAQQSIESLSGQLRDIEAKQAALEERARRLDEDLRPENIERSLALTGSTRPEELRAQRRQQLEKEKAAVQAQLDQLAVSRSRLQAAITAAETAAYQQSAGATTTTAPQTQTGASAGQTQTSRSVQPQTRTTRRRARRARVRRRSQ